MLRVVQIISWSLTLLQIKTYSFVNFKWKPKLLKMYVKPKNQIRKVQGLHWYDFYMPKVRFETSKIIKFNL